MLLFTTISNAQVTLNVQLPAAGLLQRDQLWNLVVVNNSGGPQEAIVQIQLQDAVTGQIVLTGGSPAISFPVGLRVLTPQEVQPVQYTSGLTWGSSFLPLGSFIACYRVSKVGTEQPVILAEECVPVQIQPLSPPLLQLPLDRDTLVQGYPQFVWAPPAPMEMFSGLSYDLLVTEIMTGQSPAEAVLYNTPVYTAAYLNINQQFYPPSLPALDTGKKYAWQVVARNGLQYSAQSEVWSFVVVENKRTEMRTASAPVFFELQSDGTASALQRLTGRQLHIRHYSNRSAYDGVILITDAEGKTVQQYNRTIRYGDNFLNFSVGDQLSPGTIYHIQLKEPRGKSFKGQFIIQ